MAEKEPKEPVAPSLVGMSIEQLQTLVATISGTSQTALREALRSQRKENPNYPGRSVFNPEGIFDDEGKALPPKPTLSRVTKFVKVRLDGELLSREEVELCNRFTSNKEARNGEWTAKIIRSDGGKEELRILDDYSVKDVYSRMGLPPFTHILRELRYGADAVNPDSMAKQIAELQATVKALQAGKAA